MTRVINIARKEGHLEATPHGFRMPASVEARLEQMPCVARWEYSMYDDSDFYVAVYDAELDTFWQVQTWTTRFARPDPCWDPSVNAPMELIAEYNRRHAMWRHKDNRKQTFTHNQNRRAEFEKRVAEFNLPTKARLRLRRWLMTLEPAQMNQIVTLLSTKLRSSFRKSLRDQMIRWAGELDTRFDGPFSPKQFSIATEVYKPY